MTSVLAADLSRSVGFDALRAQRVSHPIPLHCVARVLSPPLIMLNLGLDSSFLSSQTLQLVQSYAALLPSQDETFPRCTTRETFV